MLYQELNIPGRDGMKLASLLFMPKKAPRFQLLVAHGFRGRKENSGRIHVFAEMITNLAGGSLLAFDFTGSGQSEGCFAEMTLSSQIQDLIAVIKYSTSRDNTPLIILGRSFGGSTALAAGAGHPMVSGIALWSAPVLMERTFDRLYPHEMEQLRRGQKTTVADELGNFSLLPSFANDLNQHDFTKYLQAINCPVLVVQGEADEVVDPENAMFIKKHSATDAEVHLIPAAGHRFEGIQTRREEITLAWLRKYWGEESE